MTSDEDCNIVKLPKSSRKRKYIIHDSSSDDDYLNTSVEQTKKHKRLLSDSESSSHSEKEKVKTTKRKKKKTRANISTGKFFKEDRDKCCFEYVNDEDFIVEEEDTNLENNTSKQNGSKTLSSLEEVEEKKEKRKYKKRLEELQKKKNSKKITQKAQQIENTSNCEESETDESIGRTDSFIDDNEEEESLNESDDEEEEGAETDKSDSLCIPNPILERDIECEKEDVIKLLSRETKRDIQNKKNYMKQHSKYQLQPRSITNPALYTSTSKRYQRYMNDTNLDKTFKEMRGLSHNDDEYYEWVIINVLGQWIRLKKFVRPFRSMYNNRCSLKNCYSRIEANVSLIIPCMIYDHKKKIFVHRIKQDGSPAWFYICSSHYSDVLDVGDSLSFVSDWSERECDFDEETNSSESEDLSSEVADEEEDSHPDSKQINNDPSSNKNVLIEIIDSP